MGYKPKRTVYQLTFEDPDLEGLEVTTRRMSLQGFRDFIEMFEEVQSLKGAAPGNKAAMAIVDQFIAAFARVLVSWNVEDDDDRPVPPTAAAVAALDLDFVVQLTEAWITGMVQAPPPLPGGSSSGGTSAEELTLALAESSRSPGS